MFEMTISQAQNSPVGRFFSQSVLFLGLVGYRKYSIAGFFRDERLQIHCIAPIMPQRRTDTNISETQQADFYPLLSQGSEKTQEDLWQPVTSAVSWALAPSDPADL